MACYQWYDADTQTMTVILIPKDGPCYISTRCGGRLARSRVGREPRLVSKNPLTESPYYRGR